MMTIEVAVKIVVLVLYEPRTVTLLPATILEKDVVVPFCVIEAPAASATVMLRSSFLRMNVLVEVLTLETEPVILSGLGMT